MAVGQLGAGHGLEIAGHDLPDDRIAGLGGLDDHLAPLRPAPCAAGNLHHQLESPLAGPEIGVVEHVVGVENPHQRDPLEVEPLGYHLRAYQDVGFAARERRHNGAERPFGSHRIAVEPRHPRLGEDAGYLLFDFLGAESHRHHIGDLARRAFGRYGFAVAAVVADQPAACLVVGQCHVAVGTAGRPAALRAFHIG